MQAAQRETKYLSCAETAKLVRAALKEAFPGVKFSVRSSVYSGGASISVRWTNGPRAKPVEKVIERFAGADFDGMQDLKTYHTTQTADGPVHYGADFVFAYREITWQAMHPECEAYIRAHCVVDSADRFGGYFVSNLANRMIRDREEDETIEQTFQRVIIERRSE